MPSTIHPTLLKMIATTAANGRNGGGGNSRASRRICVISAASPERPADTKCQVGGSLSHIRLPIQREICNLCSKCCNKCNICNIFW